MYTSNSTDRSQDSRGDRTMGYVAYGTTRIISGDDIESNHSSFNYVVIMESCAFPPVQPKLLKDSAYRLYRGFYDRKNLKEPGDSHRVYETRWKKKEKKSTIRFVNR